MIGRGDQMTPLEDRWWALTGPSPRHEPSGYLSTAHDAFRVLDRQYIIGPLTLDPGPRQTVDYIQLLAKGWSRSVAWPIIVSGLIDREWPEVDRLASRQLHRLCCLLSLVWGEAWQVRIAPQRTSSLPPEVPEPILVPAVTWPDWDDSTQIGCREEAPLPDWFSEAWQRLEDGANRSVLAPALSLWHEGILLQSEHPSMAIISYVAAVEQVAAPVLGADGKRSSRQSFMQCVDKVATPDDLAALKKADVYGKRSATSHGGALHGIELEFGHPLLHPLGPGDPTFDFMFDTLRRMARIARSALIEALRKPLAAT